jgi:hypothetical protein
MRITWAEIAKGVLGLAGVVVVGWAYWLSDAVVDVKTQVSAIDNKISGVDGRVTRISERLPTEIALYTRELYGREIRTAVISGKAQFKNGAWTKYVAVFDPDNGSIKTYPFPVASPSDNSWLSGLLWRVSSRDTSAIRFSVLEKYRAMYDVNVPSLPQFIDADNSVIVSGRVDEITAQVDAQYKQRAAMRPDPVKPETQQLYEGTATFQELAKALAVHETAFEP